MKAPEWIHRGAYSMVTVPSSSSRKLVSNRMISRLCPADVKCAYIGAAARKR